MTEARVRSSRREGVVTVVVGDGARDNALGEADWRELDTVIEAAGADPATRAVLVFGHGDTFSAGSDMTEWADASADAVDEAFATMEGCFRAIEDCPVPVVAAVEGVAAGAGCQLALACDVVVMGESARIGMPIARLGILASPAFAARVVSRVGPALAADLYLTGRLLSGPEASSAGLVARVVPDGAVEAKAKDIAGGIARKSPEAIRAAKRAVQAVSQPERAHEGKGLPLERAVAFEDFRTSVRRFLATRRRPS